MDAQGGKRAVAVAETFGNPKSKDTARAGPYTHKRAQRHLQQQGDQPQVVEFRASERAIREIYLKAFEIVCREYDVWSVMTSYNIINGHRASENADMLTGILRNEWGYEGMVVTDRWTFGEQYKELAAGNDVKMGCGYPERVKAAFKKGLITRDQMALAAKHIPGLLLKLA